MAFVIIQIAATVAIVVLVALHVRASRRHWQPEVWAGEMGLELTPSNEIIVRSYLERTRTLRTAGAVAGLIAPFAYQALTGGPLPRPFDFGLLDALTGYLVGVVVAEVSFRRPNAPVRQASLVPRRLRDYLPPHLTIAVRVLAAVDLLVFALYQLMPPAPGRAKDVVLLPVWIMVPMVLAIAVLVELLQRSIVGRAQPAVRTDIERADDAIRSASVHALAGAGIALLLVILGVELVAIASISETEAVRSILPWAGLVCLIAALRAWIRVGRPSRWRVRRQVPGAAG